MSERRTLLFAYHTRYTLDHIERIANRRATTDRDGVSGIPGLISVTSADGDQYDFYGADENNLVLLWINDERRSADDEPCPCDSAHAGA